MAINEKNATYVFVANSDFTGTTLDDLKGVNNSGKVAIVDESGSVKTSSIISADTLVRVAANVNGVLHFSPFFKPSQATITYQAGQAALPQVTLIGHNGGSLNVGIGSIVTGNYVLRIWLNSTRGVYGTMPVIKDILYYANSSVDTQATVVKNIVDSGNSILKKGVLYPQIALGRTVDGAGGANTISAISGIKLVKLTKGSTTVGVFNVNSSGAVAATASVSDAAILTIPSYNGRSFTFTANALGSGAGRHLIFINDETINVADAGDATQNATAIAAAINAGSKYASASSSTSTVTITLKPNVFAVVPSVIYTADDSTFTAIAVSIASGESKATKAIINGTTSSAATFELDLPWEGETCYVTVGTTESYCAGTVSVNGSANWGIKVSGLPKPIFNPVTDEPDVVNFVATLNGPGIYAASYNAQKGFAGIGTYHQVAQAEVYSSFMDGYIVNSSMPPTKYPNLATINATNGLYNTFAFDVTTPGFVAQGAGINVKSGFRVMIAVDSGLFDSGESGADIKTVFGIS